ncbi:hypothetical protein Tco_1340942, partial [Tanacetum coccineum]
GKKHGRMMLDSIDHGLLVYPTVEENGHTRPKKYSKLTEAQQLQDNYDVQATNIILHGLSPDVLYNLFDKFAYVQGETLKFITDVKLAKSLYTTNYDQLYAYLSQHERHANEVRINRERYPDSLAFMANSPTLYNPSQLPQHSSYSMYPPPQQFTPVYVAPIHHTPVNPQQHLVSPPPFISPSMTPQSQAEFPQLDSGLAVLMFQQGEDPIECINKAMAFMSAVASRRAYGETVYSDKKDKECCMVLGEINKIPQNSAFQTDDLDAYDSNCDNLSSAKAVLMANLLSCDPEVLSEVPYFDYYLNDMINQDVQEMKYSEQKHVDDFEDNEIHSVEQMTDHVAHLDKKNQTNKMVNESLTAELKRYKERIAIFEQRLNVDLNQMEKLIDSQMDDLIRDRNAKLAAFQQEIDTLKKNSF